MSAGRPIAVIGAGNWGTTLAHVIASHGHPVRLWTRDPEQRDELGRQHTNTRATGNLVIASSVEATTDLARATSAVDLVLIAIPSQAFREVCRSLAAVLYPEQLVVHGTKGIELASHQRMSEILQEETCARQIGVLSGPNIAAEVAQGKPAATVIASAFPRVIHVARSVLASTQLMVFAATDLTGVELCGALKNVVAIAAGIADELGVGENAKAFLLTHGMAEMMQLASAMGAEPMTLAGLAGIGDLMVTCASPLSRNHRMGVALARGEKLEEAAERLGMVAEGIYASRSARALARQYSLRMPLFTRIDRILHEGLAPRRALDELMRLPAGRDVPYFAGWSRPAGAHSSSA
ncbi:MAG TPA: NAD(P)H-dependent glycerol-3-phosphate dehydrogenase [Polyangiaceae bacterium]